MFCWVFPVGGAVADEHPARAAIAAAHPQATRAGLAILAAGGNAFDAAVTVSAVLAVVEPYSSGIGGGGFWLLHRARDGHQVMIDGRERAPLTATRDMYLDAKGEVLPRASIDGALAAAIPGEPAALVHIARRYGRLPLSRSLAPAIALARDGFEVDEHYRKMAGFRRDALRASPAAAAQFLDAGEVPALGRRVVQPDLAATLQAIAAHGNNGFYHGPMARRLVDGVRAAGGIWTLRDLARYRVVERAPVVGDYRGWRVISAAPPSSGGIALIAMLNMLAGHDLAALDEADRVHLLAEVMRRAYRDRAEYLGDPDFVVVPVARLLDPDYAKALAADIDMQHAGVSSAMAPLGGKGADTTHFSIIDTDGNRVAATLSINYPFGACFVVPGTGVLLNDEMDDFSAKPGVPNAYGLVGNEANAIAPGKRMLSSMSPTFLESDDGVAILGTPGGSRIISMVLLGALAAVDRRPVADWVALPRIHHQYLPDRIQFEPAALSQAAQDDLQLRGHTLQALSERYGNMQAVFWDRRTGQVSAASDPRGIGQAGIAP